MASKVMTDKHKLTAYVLNKELNRTQKKIANLFDVTQPTVSSAIKEATYMVENRKMEQELAEVRQELEVVKQQALLPEGKDIIDI